MKRAPRPGEPVLTHYAGKVVGGTTIQIETVAFFCGSYNHHSQDCPDRDESLPQFAHTGFRAES
jgi:hypothetical protein